MSKSTLGTGNAKDELNRMTPASRHASLGDMLESIISNQNALIANQNAILAKLDAIGAAGASSSAIATAAGTTNVSGASKTTSLTPPSQI
ncbi:MAG TPA: hypothetical protein VFM48_08310 [Aquabacterium sp.]|nr:hypothetical protein [Aquabacterium sp.]